MIKSLLDKLKRNKLNTIKPFGNDHNRKNLSFVLCGYTESIAHALASEFKYIDQVEVVHGNILDTSCDALVSPANSFGEMSGGLDKTIDDFYKGNAQKQASEVIRQQYMGELPVGIALTLQMKTKSFLYLIVAPTMRIPGRVDDSINAYLSMRGLLVEIYRFNSTGNSCINSIAIPSLCTGVGRMAESESAEQMRIAFENIIFGKWRDVKHPAMAPYAMK